MREKIAKLQEEQDQMKNQFEEKSKKLLLALTKLKKATQLKTTLETKISQLEENVNILTAENTKLNSQIEDLTKNPTRIEMTKYNEVNNQLKESLQTIDKLNEKIEELNKTVTSKDEEIEQIRTDKESIMNVKNKLKNAYDNLKKQSLESQVFIIINYY